jgi:hypothetical protein
MDPHCHSSGHCNRLPQPHAHIYPRCPGLPNNSSPEKCDDEPHPSLHPGSRLLRGLHGQATQLPLPNPAFCWPASSTRLSLPLHRQWPQLFPSIPECSMPKTVSSKQWGCSKLLTAPLTQQPPNCTTAPVSLLPPLPDHTWHTFCLDNQTRPHLARPIHPCLSVSTQA